MLNAVQRISRLEDALKNLCETINAISGQCDGLSGFHLNGDIASFEEAGIDDAVNTAMVVLKERMNDTWCFNSIDTAHGRR